MLHALYYVVLSRPDSLLYSRLGVTDHFFCLQNEELGLSEVKQEEGAEPGSGLGCLPGLALVSLTAISEHQLCSHLFLGVSLISQQ